MKGQAELTVKAMLLGVLLAVILASANAYLGLKVGMTVSASIPAAIVSLAVLKLFRRATILENNLVQTAASAGEALAAGVIFTLPALVLMNHWDGFPYGRVTALAALGGLFGVGFSIPLRRALLADPRLRFPEGVATAQVLEAGYDPNRRIRDLVIAGVVAAALKVAQSGMKLVAGSVGGGTQVGRSMFAGGCDLSPALIAVGYIVRLPIASLVFAGGVLAWGVGIPMYTWLYGVPEAATGYEAAFLVWSSKIRYLGVGAMVVGGIASLVSVGRPLWAEVRRGRRPDAVTERDAPGWLVLSGTAVLMIPLYLVFRSALGDAADSPGLMLVVLVMAVLGGFVFSAVAGYMAGLVGSSNNPVSGVTIATILLVSLILFALGVDGVGAAAAIVVGSVVCCAAAISGDNLQDLKAGQLVGATPWRQQVMQVLGVVAGALTLGPVLNVLYQAYGLGTHLPREGMDAADALAAPQATLMQSVADGVFNRNLEWGMIGAGAVIALVVIAIDLVLRHRGSVHRVPVLAVAVGIYLPVELSVPIFLGACMACGASGKVGRGLLIASGLIAGEALAGIGLAIPFALAKDSNVLAMAPPGFTPIAIGLGVVSIVALLAWLKSASGPEPDR